MIFSILLLIAGLAILIKGADILVLGSVSIAKRFGISSLVIGLTIVAFGTSLPELIVSVVASLKNTSDIALGNIVGSNISNILLILGLTSVLSTVPVRDSTVWKEIPFSLLAIVAVGLLGADIYFGQGDNNFISRADGFILLLFFVIFLYYVFQISRGEENEDKGVKIYTNWVTFYLIVGGLIGLFVWGNMFVDGAVTIAKLLWMSERVIGLTVVAIGTSLPELVTSIVAARKGQNDIAVGNIVWSNIFNIFWVLGVSAIISPVQIQLSSFVDIFVCIGASILLFLALIIKQKNQLDRWQWLIFVMIYSAYITYLLVW